VRFVVVPLCATALLGLGASLAAQAATFCATTSAELQTDLTTAAGNNADNTIMVNAGTYVAPPGGFVYNSNSNHSLDLEGGWVTFAGSDCDIFQATGVYNLLDGESIDPVLTIATGGTTGDITLRYLTIQNGRGNPPALNITANASTGTVRVTNSLFRGNRVNTNNGIDADVVEVASYAGGVYFLDNAVVDNVGFRTSTALYLQSGDSVDNVMYVNNNTIAGNTTTDPSPLTGLIPVGAGTIAVANNIVWDGSVDDVFNVSSNAPNLVFAHNDIDGFQTPPAVSVGDINASPQFMAPGAGNYRLKGDSPARDTGENSPPGGIRIYDLDGNPRVVFGTVDMGAYEIQNEIFGDGFGG
jgi:hypothetical protein